MSEFVYIYRGGQRPTSPEQGEKEMQKWVAWLNDLGTKGHIKDRGQPLDGAGKVDEKAHEHFKEALALARNPMERRFLEQRVAACKTGTPNALTSR